MRMQVWFLHCSIIPAAPSDISPAAFPVPACLVSPAGAGLATTAIPLPSLAATSSSQACC